MYNWTSMIKQISEEARAVASPATTVIGKVETVNPLSIKIDQRLTIPESFLIVPEHLTDYETEISFDDPAVIQTISTRRDETTEWSTSEMRNVSAVRHKITVYNALKVGDSVVMAVKEGGQRYTVIGRI